MKNIYNIIVFRCLYMAVYLVSLLPIGVLYKISDLIYYCIFHVFSYRKAVVVQNLSRSFPKKNYKEIAGIMNNFYRSFSDNIVEILKTLSISAEKQKGKVVLLHFDVLKNEVEKGKHIIACMGHCGNWEILNVLPDMLNMNSYAVYKPLRIKPVDRLFLMLRSRFGMQLITAKSVVRHFISNKNNPSIYFMLADQCPNSVDEKYRFNLLHQKTSFFSGAEKLAQATGAVVVYIHVTKISRGRYCAECKIISTDSKATKETEITQKYIHLLEQNIQEVPSDWLWTHKRWKR